MNTFIALLQTIWPPIRFSSLKPTHFLAIANIIAVLLANPTSAETKASRQYQVDTENSYIHIYTDTSGLLKSVSHRHLITINTIQGTVNWNGLDNGNNSAVGSQATLILKPSDFIVDGNAQRRAAVDKRYRKPAANWVKSGTRKNMLGKRFLNVERYPTITANIKLQSFDGQQGVFSVTLNIAGNTKQLTIPATLQLSPNSISVSGDFKLNHSDLGLKRFKAAGGAASVAETLRLIMDISANAVDTNTQTDNVRAIDKHNLSTQTHTEIKHDN